MKIEWKGGECPVSGDTLVNVYFRGGSISLCEAGEWGWKHGNDDGDIIAYEVIEYNPEKTLWDEYAIAWMKARDWDKISIAAAVDECAEVANEMMKARAK